jgi:transcriptional regulator with XRE-family HTH domain
MAELAWENNFIQQMVRLREVRKMTQTDLARRLNEAYGLPFHQPTVQRIESGERPIRLNEAYAIADILGADHAAMARCLPTPDEDTPPAFLHGAEDRFARNVKAMRELLGISQSKLAARMTAYGFKMAQSTIAKIEREEDRRPLGLGEALMLAHALGIPPADLLESAPTCPTCGGEPPAGYKCLTCGACTVSALEGQE